MIHLAPYLMNTKAGYCFGLKIVGPKYQTIIINHDFNAALIAYLAYLKSQRHLT